MLCVHVRVCCQFVDWRVCLHKMLDRASHCIGGWQVDWTYIFSCSWSWSTTHSDTIMPSLGRRALAFSRSSCVKSFSRRPILLCPRAHEIATDTTPLRPSFFVCPDRATRSFSPCIILYTISIWASEASNTSSSTSSHKYHVLPIQVPSSPFGGFGRFFRYRQCVRMLQSKPYH